MDFTKKQKKAINCLLVSLIKVDGMTDVVEAITLYEINNHLKISINESEDSLKMDFADCKAVIHEMDELEQRIIRKFFDHMAATNGVVEDVEQKFINSIFEK